MAASAHHSPLLGLQHVAGNQATSAFIQTKLMVGAAHDEHEEHADRVAARVASGAPAGPAAGAIRAADPAPAPPEVEAGIRSARGGGRALPSRLREQMESSFGADFRDVRIHTGAAAASLNEQLQARAFTTGRDIFLRDDGVENGSGRQLIAHELTHVQQQAQGLVPAGAVRRSHHWKKRDETRSAKAKARSKRRAKERSIKQFKRFVAPSVDMAANAVHVPSGEGGGPSLTFDPPQEEHD